MPSARRRGRDGRPRDRPRSTPLDAARATAARPTAARPTATRPTPPARCPSRQSPVGPTSRRGATAVHHHDRYGRDRRTPRPTAVINRRPDVRLTLVAAVDYSAEIRD